MTYTQYWEAMFNVVNAAWPILPAYIGQIITIPLIKQGLEPPNPYPPEQYYGRFTIVEATSPQTTFATKVAGQADQRQYTSSGSIFVQLFTPSVEPTGDADCRLMAEYIQGILRKGVPNVRIHNVRIKTLLSDGIYFRRNVVADYFYDETV